jgi:hypothetical protein
MNRIEVVIIEVSGMDRKTRERIKERDSKGLCIACDSDPKPQHKRKACIACHGRFIQNMPSGSKQKQVYEAECISNGLIGVSRQGQRKGRNPFKELAKKINK